MTSFSTRWRANPWRIDFSLAPSRIFALIVIAVHGLALLAVALTAVSTAWQVLLCLAIGLSAVWVYQGEKASAHTLVREQIGRWWLEQGAHAGAGELLGYHVWRYLVVMRFRSWSATGKTRYIRVVVWPDAVPADTFRRLRVRLRYGSPLRDNEIA